MVPTQNAIAREAFDMRAGFLMPTFCLFVAALLLFRGAMLRAFSVSPAEPVAFVRLMQAVPQPQLFDRETAMGPKALLDRWNPVVLEAAQKFKVPAPWLRAVMRNESGGRTVLPGDKPIASSAGALGVMQLMPDTYSQMARLHDLGSDPFDTHDNVFAAAAYLRWLKAKYGFPGMFAAYNFGPANWEKYRQHQNKLPAETRNYLKSITGYLHDHATALSQMAKIELTQPDGRKLAIDATKVSGVHVAARGEYAPSVHTVIVIGHHVQGVREAFAQVSARLRQQGVIV